MGRERVPLSSITWTLTQTVEPDDLEPLSRSMEEKVHHRPLLNSKYECVDGARQLEVYKQWGISHVDVIVTDDLDFTFKVLAQRHDSADYPPGVCRHPATPYRVEKFHQMLRPQVKERLISIRRETGRARRTGVKATPRLSYRNTMAKIVGFTNESVYSRAVGLMETFRNAKGEEQQYLRQLIERVEQGEITVYSAEFLHRRWIEENSPQEMTSVEEQTAIISNTLSMLSGMIPALATALPLNPAHDSEELQRWAKQLAPQVKALYQFSKTLQGSAT